MKDEEIHMTVKINAKDLGIRKPVEVNETNKNIKKTLKVQMKLEAFGNIDAESMTDEEAYSTFIKNQYEANEATTEYIADLLHLSESQIDKLEDLESSKTDELFAQIVQKIMHIDQIVDGDEDDGTPSKTTDISGDAGRD